MAAEQISGDGWPVGEAGAAELEPMVAKAVGAMAMAVVDEICAGLKAKVFMMREYKALVEHIAEVFLYPKQLVAPGRRVVPRGGGEDINVVGALEHAYSLHCARIGSMRAKMPGMSS